MIRKPACVLAAFLTASVSVGEIHAATAFPGHRIDLSVQDLTYDSFTGKLYATRATGLVQLDPESGATLQVFAIGGNPGRMVLDSRHRLWIGLNAEGAVLIFNLETLATEDKIDLKSVAGGIFSILDISPSLSDPATIAVSLNKDVFGRAYLVRRGAALSDSVYASHLALTGGYVFGETPDGIYRYPTQPNGISPGIGVGFPTFSAGFGPISTANFIVLGTRVYHSSGEEFDVASGETIHSSRLYPANGIAFSAAEDALYYLFTGPPSIERYARESRVHTGQIQFPSEGAQHLTVWSTNRAAYHTSDKLYILETDKNFLPADIEIQYRVTPANAQFGDVLSYSVVVTNKGPGVALDVNSVANISSNALIIAPAQTGSVLTNFIASLASHKSQEVASFTILPLGAGPLTNTFSIASGSTDTNTSNNTAVSVASIAPPNPSAPFVTVKVPAPSMAVDEYNRRLIFSAANHLLVYDPSREEFSASIPIGSNARQLAFSPTVPVMFLSYGTIPGYVTRLNSSTYQVTALPAVPQPLGTISDIAVSPAASGVPGGPFVAISDSGAIHFESASLPGRPGLIQFSEDGSRLYQVNLETCALNTFRVMTNINHPVPFELESTQPDLDCADFHVHGGLLYFESGLIYNPSTHQIVGRVPGLPLLSYVLVGPDGLLNVLERVNERWRVRRLNSTNFQEVALIDIGTLPLGETAQEAVLLENKLAFRTPASVYIVSLDSGLDPSELRLAASQTTPNEIALRFGSSQGSAYRIDHSTQISPSNWSTFQDNISGTGFTIELRIPTTNRIELYRAVKK